MNERLLVTDVPVYRPSFEAPERKPLLKQMATFLLPEAMAAAALRAYAYLDWLRNQPATRQESVVDSLTSGSLAPMDQRNADSVTVAVMSAAVVEANQSGRLTSSEVVSRAISTLLPWC